jgi:hypothetical protein
MDALRAAIDKIHTLRDDGIASTFSALLRSLDSGEHFDLARLYQLNYADFALAMSVLKAWRLDSYRYEPGAVTRATQDPAVGVSAIMLEYGNRHEQRSAQVHAATAEHLVESASGEMI